MIETIGDGIAFYGLEHSTRQSCAFPAACVLPAGRWLAGCRAAPTKAGTGGQHVLLSWSDDQGATWSEPAAPFKPPALDGKPGLFRSACFSSLGGSDVLAALFWVDHSNPALPFFNKKTGGLLDSRVFFARSTDSGQTWSTPEPLQNEPFEVPLALTGPVLVLPGGELACHFELNKRYHDISPWRHAPVMMFSEDGGKTWPEHTIVARDPENRLFFWDQRPGLLKDGRILDFFWTYDTRTAAYLDIHACESTDRGRTWSAVRRTGVAGQPAPPVSLPGGEVVMVYVDRAGPPAIRLRVSRDLGRTWPPETGHTIYKLRAKNQSGESRSLVDTWAEMEKFSLGLPVTASLPGGDILVLFYAGPETDRTDVRWARIKVKNPANGCGYGAMGEDA